MRRLVMSVLLGCLAATAADAQSFQAPKLFERTIDACPDTYRFPPVQGQQCSEDAQRLVADTFCWYQRRPKAGNWELADTRVAQKSLKLSVQQVPNDLDVGQWVPYDQGSAVFGRITCEGAQTKVGLNSPASPSDGSIRIEVTVDNQVNQDMNQIRKLLQGE